jgi:hypothetical protein
VLAAQHLLRLAGVDLPTELVEAALEIIDDRLAGLPPLDEDGKVLDTAPQRIAEGAILLQPAAALEQLLRARLVLPEVRRADAFFYLLELFVRAGGVKDSSAGRRRGAPDPRTCEAGRRIRWPCRIYFIGSIGAPATSREAPRWSARAITRR